MAITVRCPLCDSRAQYPDRVAGTVVTCKTCGEDFDVPVRGGGQASAGPRKPKKKASSSGSQVGLVLGVFAVLAVLGIGGAAAGFLWLAGAKQAAPQTDPAIAQAETAVPAQSAIPRPATPPGPTLPGLPARPVVAPGTASPAMPAAAKPDSAKPTPAQPVASGFQPLAGSTSVNSTPTRLTFQQPTPWKLEVDAPADATGFASQKPLKLKLDRNYLRDHAVVYPVTRGDVVGVRAGFGSQVPFELFQLTTGKKLATVPLTTTSGAIAISPGGEYVATSQPGRNSIVVYDVKAKKPLGELPTGTKEMPFRVSILAMPRADRLVAVSQLERGVKVWELPSGNPVCTVSGDDKFAPFPLHTFSQGGRYIALNAHFLEKRIEIYDLDDGKLAGTIAIEGQTSSIDLGGMGFSADGTRLAVLYDVSRRGDRRDFSQFVVWNVADGKIVSDFDLEPRLKEQLKPAYQKERLEPFPGSHRWLVHSTGIVDTDEQKLIYSFPHLERVDLQASRRVMGPDWLVAAAVDTADARLETVSLDEASLAAASKIADAGGLAMDTGLPPLTAADYTTAAAVVASTSWSAAADPAPAVPAGESARIKEAIPVDTATGVIREVAISGSAEPRLTVRVALGENANDPEVRGYDMLPPETRRFLKKPRPVPLAKKSTLETFDAVTGSSVSKVTLPFSGSLKSISPDGKRALVALHRGEGRLDIFSLEDEGKPLLGWRPYRAAKESRERELIDADFVDDQHVVTLNIKDELVVWKLEPLAPVYRIDDVTGYEISSGGQWIVAFRDNRSQGQDAAVFSATSGDGAGTVALEGRVTGSAFHPQGDWLAISHGDEAGHSLTIVSLASGEILNRIPVPDLADEICWAADDFLLLDRSQLVSREHQAVVWSYEPGPAVFARSAGDRYCTFAIPAGNRWQVKSPELPGATVSAKLNGADFGKQLLVKPGTTVGLEIKVGNEAELGDVKAEAEAKLKQRLTDVQLQVASGQQPVQVSFDASLKSLDTVELSQIGNRTEKQSVLRKTIHLVTTFQQGGKVIWKSERKIGNLDGLILQVRDKSAQETADKNMATTAARVLSSLKVPGYVFSDDARKGLGSTPLAAVK